MPSETVPFSEWLLNARTAMGLTQRELGAKAGIAWSMVSKYENGHSVPRRPIRAKLQAILHASPIAHSESDTAPATELDQLIDEWIARHGLMTQAAMKLLAIKIANTL
ncbi:helix-turn-helix transcriptional regulator [Pseudomonas sp. PNPG3]|uniref:helix-turn-helix domain-containing protein n=1 Tax=Pseudomonas sp. PNPG3 TaxID=2919497 RepID=UPI001FFDA65B|nr:helix-turn-helix transcriptional regulator [Pseudomonas sp. PNPG3]MCK2122100.1 helix-turn-helix domain-containing protein [Pseudomonas sp. PNPG3]